MLFTSIEFALFLPLLFALYWGIGAERRRAQNALILAASYLFYGWWDWRFMGLIALSSVVDYLVGLSFLRTNNPRLRKFLLGISLTVNLGMLGFFKYFNFFLENFVEAFTFFGHTPNISSLKIILPIGISFYTFQTLGYTIDAYKRKIEPTRDAVAFFSYVAFFPQLVAGPIERAKNLLPQFANKRSFRYEDAQDGLRQILWGMFKKVVIADSCAVIADDIFTNHADYNSSTLFLGMVFFSFQIYCDFSGYSDIAIGTARLFGFRLMRNFAYPFFSRSVMEFWQRWHISLNSWFVDYVYVPLGGNRSGTWRTIRNVMLIFILSGFWHGANWTYLLYGILCGLLFVPLLLSPRKRRYKGIVAEGRLLPSPTELFQMTGTYLLTISAVILFRAESLTQASGYMLGFVAMDFHPFDLERLWKLDLVLLLVVWEWFSRQKMHGLEMDEVPQWLRWVAYIFLAWMVLYHSNVAQTYVYFQF